MGGGWDFFKVVISPLSPYPVTFYGVEKSFCSSILRTTFNINYKFNQANVTLQLGVNTQRRPISLFLMDKPLFCTNIFLFFKKFSLINTVMIGRAIKFILTIADEKLMTGALQHIFDTNYWSLGLDFGLRIR